MIMGVTKKRLKKKSTVVVNGFVLNDENLNRIIRFLWKAKEYYKDVVESYENDQRLVRPHKCKDTYEFWEARKYIKKYKHAVKFNKQFLTFIDTMLDILECERSDMISPGGIVRIANSPAVFYKCHSWCRTEEGNIKMSLEPAVGERTARDFKSFMYSEPRKYRKKI